MSLLPNTSDIPELRPVEPGEYDLRVLRAKETESKKTGRKGIMLIIDIEGEDNAEDIINTLWLPMAADDEDKTKIMLRMIKEFVVAVGLPEDGSVELDDFVDLSFSAALEIEDNEFGRRNTIKRIL